MTESNLEKWIKALRSGKYEKIKGTYCRDQNQCCAVGALLISVGTIPIDKIKSISWLRAAAELGLSMEQQSMIFELNDADDLTFPQIADYLENEKERFLQ